MTHSGGRHTLQCYYTEQMCVQRFSSMPHVPHALAQVMPLFCLYPYVNAFRYAGEAKVADHLHDQGVLPTSSALRISSPPSSRRCDIDTVPNIGANVPGIPPFSCELHSILLRADRPCCPVNPQAVSGRHGEDAAAEDLADISSRICVAEVARKETLNTFAQ
jgi:hypothetical protein